MPADDPVDRLAAATIARKVNREGVVILGWGRAILLQLAHPLVAAGVADHSGFRDGPAAYVRRSRRTIAAMLGLTFGSPEEIQRRADRINAIHARVHGTLGETAGRFPAGTAYTATDPELLGWVHATLIDSQLLAYELFVGSLTADEKDQYCAEATAIGPLLGAPADSFPATTSALERYMQGMLVSDAIAVTPTARELAEVLLSPPGAILTGPLMGLARVTTIGLLPPAIREAYGFTWSRRRERVRRGTATLLRRVRAALPPLVREWPAAREVS